MFYARQTVGNTSGVKSELCGVQCRAAGAVAVPLLGWWGSGCSAPTQIFF